VRCTVVAGAVGKSGVGKSSTANSLLNEAAFAVTPFQQDISRPATATRSTAGFKLRVIDTPGLVDGDTVSERVRWLQVASYAVERAEHT
jgi:putative ribosome biogenesis GTPase RsgA